MKGLTNIVSTVEVKLMRHFGLASYHKIKAVYDALWSVACLMVFPTMLLATGINWYRAPSEPIRIAEARTAYYKNSNEDLQIPSPVVVGTGQTNKSIYYAAWIEDGKGERVFQYPTMSFKAGMSQDIRLQFPSSLPEGDYQVKGQLRYAANPVQDVTVDLGFGKVTVY